MCDAFEVASQRLGAVAVVDRHRAPAQPVAVARHRGEDVRADLLLRIADRDRDLDAEIEHLAAVREPLLRVAPDVKLLRRAADVDRHRHHGELGVERGLGGGGLLGLGRLGIVLGRGEGVEPGLCFGLGLVELRAGFLSLRRGFLLALFGLCLCFVGFCGGDGAEVGVGNQ